MKPWLSWTRWLNPLYYGFEAAMSNEFHDTTFDCVGGSLVPAYGQGNNFACTVQGSQVGEAFVTGDAYLEAALGYRHSHLWRNVGIIIALWIFLVAVTAAGVERLRPQGAEKSYLLFQRTNDKDEQAAIAAGAFDEEKAGQPGSGGKGLAEQAKKIKRTETVFTWKGAFSFDVHAGPS
jgi:ATP-binding cassette subfamily G (WHITE) protein 2 (SNQ2)